MCNKIDINEINRIPKDEFAMMLQNWMEDEEIRKACEGQLRNNLIHQFINKTALGRKMENNNKKTFEPKNQAMNTIEAEHLYCNKCFLTLSVLSTEKQIPNFENEKFRFDKHEIKELLNILGLMKDDSVVKHITNIYESSRSESLLSILIKQLISSHKRISVECRTVSTQTEEVEENDDAKIIDLSQTSCRSKARKSKRKNHSLAAPAISECRLKKAKKSKGVSRIAKNLDSMSQNINLITNKLEDFRKSSSHDDSKSIIATVGTIMLQLNDCVKNFERLCDDIKTINDAKLPKNYDEWIVDMKHSENGRKFLKKFTKSFKRILSEERAKMRKECQRKFDKEKRKLARFHQLSSAIKSENVPESNFSKDINKIYESTVIKLKNIEKENEIFEQSIHANKNVKTSKRRKENLKREGIQVEEKTDMNKCRQIHSKESSSITTNPQHSYSTSFEDMSETNI